MESWIGLPEEDGGIPILIVLEQAGHLFTYIDILGRKEDPILYVDQMDAHIRILEQYQDQFVEISTDLIHQICFQAYDLLQQRTETWDVVQQFLPAPKKLPTLPNLMDAQDIDLEGLMNSNKGICIAIPDAVLLEGLQGIQLIKKQNNYDQLEQQGLHTLIEAVITTTANLALQNMHREWWVLVMECMGVIHDSLQNEKLAQTARVNARYFQIYEGCQIPILQKWTEHYLLQGTAMARFIEKNRQ